MGKLTALSFKAAKAAGRYQDGDGLMLVVKPTGARSWLLRAQVNGKRRDFGLGSANLVPLSEAREKAREVQKLYRAGVDPVAARQAATRARAGVPTFEEAARQAHEDHKGGWRNEKHKAQWISTLSAYAFPFIGSMPVDQVTGPMIRDLLLPIWLNKPETARRVRQRIGAVLDWAHVKGLRQAEAPMRSLGKGLPRQPKKDRHFAAVPYEAVAPLMAKLSDRDSIGRIALRFLVLTAARSGEVRGAIWEEISLEDATWTVPAIRMKANKEHVVPLSAEALKILDVARRARRGLNGEPIFPGPAGGPMSDMTLTKVLRTAYAGAATVHGFRSSFRDWAAERTSYAGDVVEAALAHTNSNKVEAAYRRTSYLEKRRSLMDDWASFVTDGSVTAEP